MARTTSASTLLCPACGKTSQIQRLRSKEENHIKDLYCPHCKSLRKFLEATKYDDHQFQVKAGLYECTLNLYSSPTKVSITLNLPAVYIRKWLATENDIYNTSVVGHTDYSILETVVMNFLDTTNEDFKTFIMHDYNSKPAIDGLMMTEPLKLELSKSIYSNLATYCKVNNLDIFEILSTLIIKVSSVPRLNYNFNTKNI